MSFRVSFLILCFSVLLVLRLPRLGKRELILVLFVRLFGLCLFRFVGFPFLLGSGKSCGLWLWHSLDFSLTFFTLCYFVVYSTRRLPCVILFLYFSVLLPLRLPRLGKGELILVLLVRLFVLRLFGFVSSSSWYMYLGRTVVCECGTPWTKQAQIEQLYEKHYD